MATIKVDVVSAEEEIFSGQAKFVALPGEAGELGILPGHTPLITRIRPGAVRIEAENGEEEFVFVAGGILEIQPGAVTVLADTAIRGKDLDEAKAEDARKRAEEALQNTGSNLEYATAQAELAYATAQLAAIQRLRKLRERVASALRKSSREAAFFLTAIDVYGKGSELRLVTRQACLRVTLDAAWAYPGGTIGSNNSQKSQKHRQAVGRFPDPLGPACSGNPDGGA
jgi:F-type H+-transporting ATPase subunit epsilon